MVNDQHSFFHQKQYSNSCFTPRKIIGKKPFWFSAGKIWNALPVSFKKGVNRHLREELITEAQSDFHFY